MQVPPPDRPRMGRLDRPGCLCETCEEIGPHERGTKTTHALQAGRGSSGGVRQEGSLRELGLWRRPDDREQDSCEDAGHGEGIPERSLRGEAQVRHHTAVLERATGKAETILD